MFQSAPPHGGRLANPGGAPTDNLFQSAPPHGGRLAPPPVCFNPRPRTGGDLVPLPASRASMRFNPRPRTGGD